MMSNMNALRIYAQKSPNEIPRSILFAHSDRSLTIFDAFPKSIFHFLLLPRLQSDIPLSLNDLQSLKTLLRADKSQAQSILSGLRDDATKIRGDVEAEMLRTYGFKWPVWMGFHAVPSMTHLHIHVMSADLCSPKMKHKKHYNSFHPKVGFFLDIDEVMSWFDADPSYFSIMARLEEKEYEALIKTDLSCFHCGSVMANIPKLKAHLQDEFDTMITKEAARAERKRKWEEKLASNKKQKNEEEDPAIV